MFAAQIRYLSEEGALRSTEPLICLFVAVHEKYSCLSPAKHGSEILNDIKTEMFEIPEHCQEYNG